MGDLYNDSLLEAAEELKKHPNADLDVWDETLEIYGNLAGLHLQAQLDAREQQDLDDQATKDMMAMVFNTGVGAIPTPAGFALKWGVKIAQHAARAGIRSWKETDPETTRKALLKDSAVQASFLTDYQLLNALKEADFPGTDKIPPSLLEDGHLISPDKIAKDPDLFDSYRAWVDSTDEATSSDLDSMTESGAGLFKGGIYEGQAHSTGYDWD